MEGTPKIAALVKNLHDGCWLAYNDLSTVVLHPIGVRQGCESGPMIFNSIYQLATEAVKDKLREEGILMSLPAPSGELWDSDPAVCAVRERSTQGQCGEHHDIEEILDVYFVDDGCYMTTHKKAAELVKRMRLLVATIVSIFSSFQLSVNMAKGKTEVMLGQECDGWERKAARRWWHVAGYWRWWETGALQGACCLGVQTRGNMGEFTSEVYERC